MINITPFGGCLIHNPLAEFYRRNKTFGLYSKQNGWGSRPFSLSANTNLQLVDFITGRVEIPRWIRSYIYFEAVGDPTEEQGRKFLAGDIALVEMSTPLEYSFDRFLLNVNQFELFVRTVLEALDSERKLIGTWHRALKQGDEDARGAAAEQIGRLIPKDTPEREIMTRFVLETRSRLLTADDMTTSMADLRDRLGIPVAMILHNFSYMPDGRPISWPADFKANSIEVARRLNIPTFDLAPFVRAEGVDKTLSFDRRHYQDRHLAPVGEMMNDFCAAVLDPSHPGPRDVRIDRAQSDTALEQPAALSATPGDTLGVTISEDLRENLGREFGEHRARLNEALNRARAVDRAEDPRLYLAVWKDVLDQNPHHLAAIRRMIGAAAFLKDYAELADALIAHLEVTPGDTELAAKLASAALRSGREVRALEYLAHQKLVDLSVRPIEQLHTRVLRDCGSALAASDHDRALICFRALELADAGHPEMEALKPTMARIAAAQARTPMAPPDSGAIVETAVAYQGDAGPRQYGFDRKTGGQLPQDRSTVFAVMVLGESSGDGADDEIGAEISDGVADQIFRNCQTRFGARPNLQVLRAPRDDGGLSRAGLTQANGLARGSPRHRAVMRLLGHAREAAAGRGEHLEVVALCLVDGEHEAAEGVPGSLHRRGLSSLQLQYDADIRALTGQTEPVRLYLTQTDRISPSLEPDIPLAQLNAKFDNPQVQCVGPTYFAAPACAPGSGPRIAAAGYRRIGQLFGRFLLDDLWGPQRDPLRIEDAYWIGEQTIRVRYNRPIGLESDNARIDISGLGPALGFEFSDGAPQSPTIGDVQRVRGRDAELDLELTAPSSGFRKRLLVALQPNEERGDGQPHGARSAIRSRDAFDIDPLDGTQMFDWACTEVVDLQ